MTQQDPLDRRRGQVLAVDAQPVGRPARRSRRSRRRRGRRGRRSSTSRRASARRSPPRPCSSPRTAPAPVVFTSSPVASSRLSTGAVRVEPGARALLAGHRVEHLDALERQRRASPAACRGRGRPPRRSRSSRSRPHAAAEALGERRDVAVARLVAERQPQRVVGVVGPRRGGEHVGERLADVVEVRRAVAADVVRGTGWPRTCARRAMAPPHTRPGPQPAITALEWNSGIET